MRDHERDTPPPQVWPTLRARDARALIDFLVAGVGIADAEGNGWRFGTYPGEPRS